jgi:pimeloyl-ACP methyl ester carboxylesterase
MLTLVLASMLVAIPFGASDESMAPGDGLVLSPTPVVRSAVHLPSTTAPEGPAGFGAFAGIGAIVGGAALLQTRRRRDDEPLYVVVHGNGGSAADFDTLLAKLGASRDRVVAFDYRDVGGGATSTEASRTAPTERAAVALDELIRSLSYGYSNIYSLHHSRGGAVGATMIGNLDDGSSPKIDGYIGAALLDPAIAGGVLGGLQRAGGISSWLPDNGGFETTRCTDGECRDVREHLGRASGVEVIAIRNLDAEVTNFRDNPEGLRVYDLEHDGGIAARFMVPLSPLLAFRRVWSAHTSVLKHEAVADCIKAELVEQGSCVWDDQERRTPVWSGGGGGGGSGGAIRISLK